LVLREIVAADAGVLLSIHGDPELMRWFGNDPLPDMAAAAALIQTFNGWRQLPNPGIRWGLERKQTPGLIGTCGLFAWNRQWRKCVIVDAMAASGQKDLIPGMQHELFHRYHRQFFGFEASSAYPRWTALWAEGMASYVSERLNPSASDLDLSRVPLGMVREVDDRRGELAADFLRRFESTAEKDATLYFNNTNSKDAFVPARAGYQLGVRRVAAGPSRQSHPNR
jgi:RimJ/RimL family protein N-acetyltransferase